MARYSQKLSEFASKFVNDSKNPGVFSGRVNGTNLIVRMDIIVASCPICTNSYDNSKIMKCTGCNQYICKECIGKLYNQKCPLCNTTNFAFTKASDIEDLLQSLPMNPCTFTGCTKKFMMNEDLKTHTETCLFGLIQCPWCPATIPMGDLICHITGGNTNIDKCGKTFILYEKVHPDGLNYYLESNKYERKYNIAIRSGIYTIMLWKITNNQSKTQMIIIKLNDDPMDERKLMTLASFVSMINPQKAADPCNKIAEKKKIWPVKIHTPEDFSNGNIKSIILDNDEITRGSLHLSGIYLPIKKGDKMFFHANYETDNKQNLMLHGRITAVSHDEQQRYKISVQYYKDHDCKSIIRTGENTDTGYHTLDEFGFGKSAYRQCFKVAEYKSCQPIIENFDTEDIRMTYNRFIHFVESIENIGRDTIVQIMTHNTPNENPFGNINHIMINSSMGQPLTRTIQNRDEKNRDEKNRDEKNRDEKDRKIREEEIDNEILLHLGSEGMSDDQKATFIAYCLKKKNENAGVDFMDLKIIAYGMLANYTNNNDIKNNNESKDINDIKDNNESKDINDIKDSNDSITDSDEEDYNDLESMTEVD